MKLRSLSVYLLMLFAAQAAFSQGASLFNAGGNSKRDKALPTVITADTMDIQTAKNIAIFTGNVVVKDQELTINCLKMTIYLEEKTASTAVPAGAVPGGRRSRRGSGSGAPGPPAPGPLPVQLFPQCPPCRCWSSIARRSAHRRRWSRDQS